MATKNYPKPKRSSSGDVNLELDSIEDELKELPPGRKKPPPPPPRRRHEESSLDNRARSNDGVEDALVYTMGFASSGRQSLMGSYLRKIGDDAEEEEEDLDGSNRGAARGTAKSVQSKLSNSHRSGDASDDGSISINDVFLSGQQDSHASITSISQSGSTLTDGLSVMEKLKLASKLDASCENLFLKELIETSIKDLEEERRKKRSSKSKEPRSLPSRHDSRKPKKKDSCRSLSNSVQSDQCPSLAKSSSRRRRRSIESNDDSYRSAMTDASTMAALPKQVRAVFSRVRGGEPLPRDDVVSTVVRKLITRSMLVKENDTSGSCIALIPNDSQCSEGIGKTTIAGLVCSRADVKTHYHRGIAWVDMKQKGGGYKQCSSLDYEQYAAALPTILTQCGISPHHLKLSPFISTPCEDQIIANIRMKVHMEEARVAMGKVLSSSRLSLKGRKASGGDRSILIVLDDLVNTADIEWFTFRYRGDKEAINDVLVTSAGEVEGSVMIPVPPLSSEESVKLILMEAALKPNHPTANTEMSTIVKRSLFHPLTIKFVGRWLNLKRMTGNKGFDESLKEIVASFNRVDASARPVDVLYAVLNQAIAPNIKGEESKIIRLCFAAFMTVFQQGSCFQPIPLEVANELFLGVAESKGDLLSGDGVFACPLYKRSGRQATKLVPEILGALGVFSITKHTTKEKSIQIDYELIRHFGAFVLKDETIGQLADGLAIKCWNEVYANFYFDQYNWEDHDPDRAQKYAMENLAKHMIAAEMMDAAQKILLDKAFIRGRFWTLGCTEGTKAHVEDLELFWEKFHLICRGDCDTTALRVSGVMESVLISEVSRDTVRPAGHCSILDAGQCLHMVSMSLGKMGLWEDAAKLCDTCVELVSRSSDGLVASLLYNSAIMHLEANNFEVAKEVGEDLLALRAQESGKESILYAHVLSLLGDIMFKKSDYPEAEAYFSKSIAILKLKPEQCNLDLALAILKLGKTQYERGLIDDALKCYDDFFELAESELPPNHEYFINTYNQIGNALLKKGDHTDAIYPYEKALKLAKEIESKSHHLTIRMSLIGGGLHSINGESDKTIEQYRSALKLLRLYEPCNMRNIARVISLIGIEFMKNSDVDTARAMFQESIRLIKHCMPMHLDLADVLLKLSRLEESDGKHIEAAECLEEGISILKTKMGECKMIAVNLTYLGDRCKAAGKIAKAQDAYNESIRILRGLGNHEQEIVNALWGLADLMITIGEHEAALNSYNECLETQKAVFGETHENVAITLYLIGVLKLYQCRYSTSHAFLAESVDIMIALKGENHPYIGDAYNMMGFVEMKNGNVNGALRKFSDALRVRRATGDRLKEAETLKNMGNVYRERNELDLALEQHEECLGIITEEKGRDSEAVVDVLIAMGSIMSDMNFHEGAMSHFKNALQKLLRIHSANHESVASILQKMGMMQFRAGNLDSGLLHLEKSVETYRQLGGDNIYKVIPSLFVIGNIHNVLKQVQEAQRAWKDAYDVCGTDSTGSHHYPEIKGSLMELLHLKKQPV